MGFKNRIREQYKNIAVLLRRTEHVSTDYDVFVVIEESVEAARAKAAMNARKFFEVTDEALISWEDWLDNSRTKAMILGYTNKPVSIVYKGYNDHERQPLPAILKNIKRIAEEGEED